MMQKLKALFKMARLIASNDEKDILKATYSYLGKQVDGAYFVPYGLISRPPAGSIAMVFSQNGDQSKPIGIADSPKERGQRGNAEYETGLENYKTGNYIILKDNGDIDVISQNNVNVQTVADVNVNAGGNITANSGGDVKVTASGDITGNATNITLTASNGASFTIGSTSFTMGPSGLEITNGDVVADGISLKTHKHGGVVSGGDETDVPV